ncbi:hypothetical protein BHE89_08085 [Shigella sp. FC1967]|nr:hypothetical protein BHE89_08085 [Shigella sp. FC1967]
MQRPLMKAKNIVKWALTVFIIITNYLILFLLNMGYAVTKKYQLDQPWSDQLTPQGLQEIADMLTQSNELISTFAMLSFPTSLLLIVIIHKALK